MSLILQTSKQGFLGLHRLVKRLLAEDGFLDRKTALKAISAYERFLMLVVRHQTEPLSPSHAVDLVWQRHMLDTRVYMQDCYRLAGKYIHRFCSSPPNSFERCVQILKVSGDAEWEHPSSSHALANLESNIACLPYSSDLDKESLSELVERVRFSLQSKSSNVSWVSQSLLSLESDSIQVVSEYKRFLSLLITENIALTPSKLIDEFWHQHILNSTEYFQFCIRTAGRYIHHTPHYEKPHNFHRNGFNQTQTLYKKYFGIDAPQTIWSYMGESSGEPEPPEPLYFIDSPTSVAVKLIPRKVNRDHYTQIHPIFLAKGMSIDIWRGFLKDIDSIPLMSWEEYMNSHKDSYFICIWMIFAPLLFLVVLLFPTLINEKLLSILCFLGFWVLISLLSLIADFSSRGHSTKSWWTIISRYSCQFAEMDIIVTQSDYRTITIKAHL